MCVLQTRPIGDCNEEFASVLTTKLGDVQETIVEEELEKQERAKIDRKKRFYEEYADKQLARIVTSLMVKDKKAQEKAKDEDKENVIKFIKSHTIVDLGGGKLVEKLVDREMSSDESYNSDENEDEVDKMPWEWETQNEKDRMTYVL